MNDIVPRAYTYASFPSVKLDRTESRANMRRTGSRCYEEKSHVFNFQEQVSMPVKQYGIKAVFPVPAQSNLRVTCKTKWKQEKLPFLLSFNGKQRYEKEIFLSLPPYSSEP